MRKKYILNLFLASVLTGTHVSASAAENDPLEPFNRGVFYFNQKLDKFVIKPVARGYTWIVPKPYQGLISNFFNNLHDFSSIYNDFLQGKGKQGVNDFGRFVINSTLGGLGFVDVATGFGLQRHNEDLGQTFAHWGWKNSTYLVIPVLGPTNIRDGIGRLFDYRSNPESWAPHERSVAWDMLALDYVQTRASYLEKEKTLEAAAVDKYAATRAAYTQHRRYLIDDGQIEDALPPDGELGKW